MHRGAWIFVSHSNRDIEKVREIRNELERRGHNPVLFFLKCMETTEADDRLLWQLIEREIKAREWFILCDSPNARNSAAVLREMEMVKSMAREGKVVETIDLGRDLETEIHKVIRLSKRATVFLSYASADHATADAIRRALMRHEFTVTSPEDFGASAQPIQDAISTAINAAVERGFVLVLLSPASLASRWVKHETEYALQLAARSQRSNVVPVTSAPFATDLLSPQLADIQWFDLTTGPFEARVEELIRSLKTREMG